MTEKRSGCLGGVFVVVLLVLFIWIGAEMDQRCADKGGVWLHREWKCVTGIKVLP